MRTYSKNSELLSRPSPRPLRLTQCKGTERPFSNESWDNKEPCLYVKVVSGGPRYSSFDNFDSGTGWPRFTARRSGEHGENADGAHGMTRTKGRLKHGDSHL